jgi:hypothetical protein
LKIFLVETGVSTAERKTHQMMGYLIKRFKVAKAKIEPSTLERFKGENRIINP